MVDNDMFTKLSMNLKMFIHLSLVLFKQGIVLDCIRSVSCSPRSLLWCALWELSKYYGKLFSRGCSNRTRLCSDGACSSLLFANIVEFCGI